jgi:predicted nucleic acid-binding protein
MKRRPEIFVDTSVWIPYFRDGGSEFGDVLDGLIDENRVHINGVVLAELLTGTRTSEEFGRLSDSLAGLKYVAGDRASFTSAGRNGFVLKKKGISVPLSDLLIATDCIDHDLTLLDRDQHFARIAAHLPLRRFVKREILGTR